MSPTLVTENTRVDTVSSGQEGESRVEIVGDMLVLPGDLLRRYIDIAMRSAVPRRLEDEDGQWYADLSSVAGFSGVWADGDSPKACLDALAEVLYDWLILKIADRDRDLPIVDDIDLTVLLLR